MQCPPTGKTFVVGTISDAVAQAVQDQLSQTLASRDITISDQQIAHIRRDTKAERLANLPGDLVAALPSFLQIANAWIDPVNKNLIYTISLGPGLGKIAVHLDRWSGRAKAKRVANTIATAGVAALNNSASWVLIK